MTTIIFVHGTGVRGAAFSRTFRTFKHGVGELDSRLTVVPFGWGEFLGTELAFGGASIPGYLEAKPGSPRAAPSDVDAVEPRWDMLESYPLHDLHFLAEANAAEAGGGTDFALRTLARCEKLPQDEVLAAELADADLLEYFRAAVAAITGSPVTTAALRGARTVKLRDAMPMLLAEAIISEMTRQVSLAEGSAPPVSGPTRTRWVRRTVDLLGGQTLGPEIVERVRAAVRDTSVRLGGSVGSLVLEQWRHPLSRGAQSAIGDVLQYLVRGEPLRTSLADRVAAIDDSVVLVGHSLGGIACLDLLLLSAQPKIRALITVGSQGSLLYELNALPGLPAHAPLPATLPPWLNVYYRRDLLSYLAAPIFGIGVTDLHLDNDCGMPRAHSAYFDNPDFYQALGAHLSTAV